MRVGFVLTGCLLLSLALLLLYLAFKEVRDTATGQLARLVMVSGSALVVAATGGALIAYGVIG